MSQVRPPHLAAALEPHGVVFGLHHDKATHAALYLASFSRMARHALSESYGAGGSRAGLASLVLAWRHGNSSCRLAKTVEGRDVCCIAVW